MQRTVFLTSLLGGLALACTIYFGLFNQLSETMLVQLSGLWFVPFIFGFYGMLARMAQKSEAAPTAASSTSTGAAASASIFAIIVRSIARVMPPAISLGLILLFCLIGLPLLLVKSRKPFVIASLGLGMWMPVLVVFLLFIFPSL